jgi:hypothetical protein
MLTLNWPLVFTTTILLYLLTLVTLPFGGATASIFLFALIAYWSRLPGVGIYNPLTIIYQMDVVDIFSLLIALHIGPIQGVIFTLFANYASRAAGVFPEWPAVIKDGLAQSMACVIVGVFAPFLGGNIIAAAIIYTLLRELGFFLLWIVWPPWGLAKQVMIHISQGGVVLLINTFYATMLGDFMGGVLQKGVAFNWMLFFFATGVILLFYLTVFNKSKSVSTISLKKITRKVVRLLHKKK